ncbi:hypothetical protein K1X12_05535 [Hyphomonas sp. WL0036]|jgi:hypothetical protein|uniref:hypothetical protein n=1 Tax=Hyphomonas sediminis TaxID=2866160 RepID=UPI001C817A63|nr:hypothetical protein [Hyphomonas sediminis]MBY9066349.1 hypothetical protein [Hyphomonas sediminis]
MRSILTALLVAGLAACSGAAPPELTATLQPSAPGPGYQLGGSIDSITIDDAAGTVTVQGWNMFTPKTREQELKVFASNAAAIESVTRSERPDVVEAIGNEDLLHSGFVLVLKMQPDAELTQLCITQSDKHYGDRLLMSYVGVTPTCFSEG